MNNITIYNITKNIVCFCGEIIEIFSKYLKDFQNIFNSRGFLFQKNYFFNHGFNKNLYLYSRGALH